MYRIMRTQSKRKNFESLYQYITTNEDSVITPLELATKEELDARIEKMLNEDGYAKDDFIVVQVVDYSIDATAYTDDKIEEETPKNSEEENTL